ncbi:probable mitochondrial import inner membrane translocase subunit TIM21 [Gastrolobium bilobum]|uniref:probable mitochondrial import inner membrane translocase subunit TIM21 n=1 Tax=Gastrolobium bilobum TaxID=150636 RepID=UPI002AAFD547|nr:probable mitochondrial import inner membrane translocase subunit TIM21 [Gastrolobium bilobum]
MFRRIGSHRTALAWTHNAFRASSQVVSSETRILTRRHAPNRLLPCFLGTREDHGSTSFARFISSKASNERRKSTDKTRKDITNVEDPFDAPTYNIPEKPVTFVEGASYSVIILAGLGVAVAAGYAVFKELIFQPKEYKIYSKALKRIQDDGQVRVRIGSPITGYGQESRNRAARQRIPNRVWTDEDGAEHVEVNFYIRGPHGHGKVFCEMFKGPADNEWKFTYLIVEIRAPSPAQLILESYIPAYNANK